MLPANFEIRRSLQMVFLYCNRRNYYSVDKTTKLWVNLDKSFPWRHSWYGSMEKLFCEIPQSYLTSRGHHGKWRNATRLPWLDEYKCRRPCHQERKVARSALVTHRIKGF